MSKSTDGEILAKDVNIESIRRGRLTGRLCCRFLS
jgi:hypothetical protein